MSTQSAAMAENNLEKFTAELSELSRKFKIGIEAGTVYEMEGPEDSNLTYFVDEDSCLLRKY